ncbi:MAG TPA: CHAD domain-containing protein [Gemmataceae bacterium]|jgi:CHAD domain-containing protein|nr:CHAD domain-containing protein [Gemmataceae bacterium]
MAFQLKPAESVGKGVKRIVRKQLDNALEELGAPNRDEVVHEIRKRFKRVRAVLRLVRDGLGDDVYRRENACFRDAARPLTEVRDAMVLVEALDKLAEAAAGHKGAAALPRVRQILQADLQAVRQHVLDEEGAFARVRELVQGARARLRDWSIRHKGWSAIRPGLKRVYKNARLALAGARADRTTENLHEWRKQTKYLWHQLQLLEPTCPEAMKELVERSHELTQLLGDDHDLAVLRAKVTDDSPRFAANSALDSLLELLDRRRREIQEKAFVMAEPFFSAGPKEFTCRLKHYWKAWRKKR